MREPRSAGDCRALPEGGRAALGAAEPGPAPLRRGHCGLPAPLLRRSQAGSESRLRPSATGEALGRLPALPAGPAARSPRELRAPGALWGGGAGGGELLYRKATTKTSNNNNKKKTQQDPKETLTPFTPPASLPSFSSLYPSRPGQSQSARRSVYQWQAFTQPYPAQDSGDGPPWHKALCHLPPAASVPRLRLQNSLQVPGDGLHPAGGHRRQQAQGEPFPPARNWVNPGRGGGERVPSGARPGLVGTGVYNRAGGTVWARGWAQTLTGRSTPAVSLPVALKLSEALESIVGVLGDNILLIKEMLFKKKKNLKRK